MFHKDKKIKRIVLGLKTMNDYSYQNELDLTARRNLVRICFIDDEGYPNVDRLKAIGYYNIDVKYNFERIEDYKEYDIIFCDLEGVGKHMDSTLQGLWIAEEIKNQYPNCEVFIYSGNDVDDYGELPTNIKYVPKQTNIRELSNIIDYTCGSLWDPHKAWERIYQRMLNEKIPSKIIALLEDEFVNSLENKTNNFVNSDKKETLMENVQLYVGFLLSLTDIILRVLGK